MKARKLKTIDDVTALTAMRGTKRARYEERPDLLRLLGGEFVWDKNASAGPQSLLLGGLLSESNKVFRTRAGQIVVLETRKTPRLTRDQIDLEALLRENYAIRVLKNGKLSGNAIPGADLKVFLRSEELQKQLPVSGKNGGCTVASWQPSTSFQAVTSRGGQIGP